MADDVHIRDIIKYTDYKRFGSTAKIIFDGQEVKSDQPAAPNGQSPPKQPKQ
jgi:hypothetical protein